MSGTLLFEVRAAGGDWKPVSMLSPVNPEGSITDVSDGRRDVILFRCEGASRSVICRAGGGIDFTAGQVRVVLPMEDREVLAELTGDGATHEMNVRTDRGLVCRVRWTHRAYGL